MTTTAQLDETRTALFSRLSDVSQAGYRANLAMVTTLTVEELTLIVETAEADSLALIEATRAARTARFHANNWDEAGYSAGYRSSRARVAEDRDYYGSGDEEY